MGKINRRGVTPPQQGRIARVPDKPAVVAAGGAPLDSHAGYPAMSGIRAGTPPKDQGKGPTKSENVRSGGDPLGGGVGPKSGSGTRESASSGAAPKGGMTAPGAGRSQADADNQLAQTGRRGYAKGGLVDKVSGGIEAFGKAIGTPAGKAIKAADAAVAQPKAATGRGAQIDGAVDKAVAGYARGGKVNRHGVDAPNGGNDKNPSGTAAPAAGGNGGLPGGNAAIPVKQPGGTPSTGVIASGKMVPSYAGADTPQPGGPTPDAGGMKLRAASVKRAGGTPSLPRPRR